MLASLDDIVFDPEPHTYVRRGKRYPSVTEIINGAGLGDDFSGIPFHILQYAQMRGRMVHKACQHINNGGVDMDTVDPSIRGYVEAYQLFFYECNVKPIEVEKPRFTDNLTGYVNENIFVAGMSDLFCWMNGVRSLVDIKTGQNEGKGAPRQTAAYKRIRECAVPDQEIKARYALKLRPNGKYQLVPHTDPTDIYAFCDAARYIHAKYRMEKWRTL